MRIFGDEKNVHQTAAGSELRSHHLKKKRDKPSEITFFFLLVHVGVPIRTNRRVHVDQGKEFSAAVGVCVCVC